MTTDRAAQTADFATDLRIEVVALEDLRAYGRNARTHSSEQVAQIAASMREWGWTNPILADMADDGLIVAGHGRRMAAKSLYAKGETIRLPDGRELPPGTVLVIDCAGWSEDQRRAYVIADNKLAENAGWDEALLRIELGEISTEGFDLDLIGFDPKALEGLMPGEDQPAGDNDDDEPSKGSLADRFGIAPFSVLNAREGWWQDRKRAWLSLGIKSEVGRGDNLLKMSDTMLEPDPAKRAAMKAARAA